MRHSGIYTLIAFLFVSMMAVAQEPLNSREVEENSFRMLTDKKWSELIILGNSAIENKIDYFYLRLRIGIAYYEQKKFRLATDHFRKALEFNPHDALAQEYYYYSLLFSWQFDAAQKFATTTSDSVRNKLNVDEMKPVNMVYGEMGIKFSERTDIYANALYMQAGLNHSVKKKFSLSHVLTYYFQNLAAGPFSQFQYYLAGSIPLSKGWTLAPTFHFVNQSLDSTIYFPPPVQGRPPIISSQKVNSAGVVGTLSVMKTFGFADVGYSTGISNIEGYAQYIQQLSVTVFPMGNNKFGIGSLGYYHWESKNGGNFAFSPYVSYCPGRWALQAIYFTNQKQNLVERNGYFVNNALDLTTSRWTGIADFAVNRHFSVYGVLMLENKLRVNAETYDYKSFIIGLKIIP